jgi:hypothetical protein
LPREAYVTRPLTLVVHEDVRRVARIRLVFDALAAIFAADRSVLEGACA